MNREQEMRAGLSGLIPYIEAGICYGFLAVAIYINLIPFNFVLLIILVSSTAFGLFYGMKGILISLAGMSICIIVKLLHISSLMAFETLFLSPQTFSLILVNLLNSIIVGFWGQRKIHEQEHMKTFMDSFQSRFGFVLSELTSIERAYQDVFQKSFGLITRPAFFYQEMRALIHEIADINELFAEVFLTLERYFDVEGGIVYKSTKEGYKEVIRYGLSVLPAEFPMSELPDWIYLAQTENEVVIPANVENAGFVAVAPVGDHILIIERMKYSYLTEDARKKIGQVGFCIRLFLEKRFQIEKFRPYSIHTTILVWKEETAVKLIPERVRTCHKWDVPLVVGKIPFADRSALIKGVEALYKNIRETDEMFQVGNQLVIIFFMAKDFPTIKKILKDRTGFELQPHEVGDL